MVNIYTHTDIRGLKKKDGNAWYIIETETSKGPANVGDKIHLEQCTEKQAELTALLAAVRRIRGECEIHIYTDSSFVAAGWTVGWIEGWKEKDWKTRKGEPVAHCEIWQELEQLTSAHELIFHVKEHHSYSEWFNFENRREKEK